jgi:hypothetical protein
MSESQKDNKNLPFSKKAATEGGRIQQQKN